MDEKHDVLAAHHPVQKFIPCNVHLRDWKHYVFPGLNIGHNNLNSSLSAENAACFYTPPMLNISRPLPCIPSKFIREQKQSTSDPALQLVKKKYLWKKKKKILSDVVQKLSINTKKAVNLIDRVKNRECIETLPYGILRLTDHLSKNPDRYFKGMYNWYYGNALTMTSICDERYLLYAGGEHMNTLNITSFERKTSKNVVPNLVPKVSLSVREKDLIYDVVSSKHLGMIGVRQPNHCSFFKFLDKDENIELEESFSVKSKEYPFVCMDCTTTELCTLNVNRHVQFWNPERHMYCIEHASLPESSSFLEDNFAQMKYTSDKNSQKYLVIDRQNIFMFDKRVDYTKPCLLWKPRTKVELCEKMSLLVPSIQGNYWYIGLTHSCLLLDIRAGFTQRWTHMLTQAPSVGTSYRLNKESSSPKEALLLSAQSTNEIIAIYNKWVSDTPPACCSPVSVPNRTDTKFEGRMNGVISSPLLENKFHFSTIGLSTYKMKKRIGVFSLSSSGDIFHQSAYPNRRIFDKNSTCLTKEELIYLKNWEQETLAHYLTNERILMTTRIADFSELINYIDVNARMPSWVTRKVTNKENWNIAKRELESYEDLLAPRLLYDFGVDEIDEWCTDNVNVKTTDSVGKVQSWLSGATSLLNSMEIEENESCKKKNSIILSDEGTYDVNMDIDAVSDMSVELFSP